MKKFFRHITRVIILSFVICLFLPLRVNAGVISGTELYKTNIAHDGGGYFYHLFTTQGYDSSFTPAILVLHDGNRIRTYGVLSNTRSMLNVRDQYFWSADGKDFSSSHDNVYDSFERVVNSDGNYCYYTPITSYVSNDVFLPLQYSCPYVEFYSIEDLKKFVAKGDISEELPSDTNTDGYSLDKSLGMVKNAKWKHLESKDEYNKVLQNAMNSGTGTGDPGNANYSDIYTHYASFVQDKCSFATTSTTGVKIGGRYQLQYASRVGFTFAYNLPDLLEGIDNTKQYYKKFGSTKPYPIANGTNFDANENIQSLFVQAYAWNDTLPSIGTWKRVLKFKETKYWIDVRIIDTKNKTYGSWYAMDMETNKGSEVTTDNGDIDGDITSDDPADPYAKIEGEGDTFKDAEDNSHDVGNHTDHYDQKWYDDIKDNTKKSAPAFKNLLAMVKGIPSMIKTLFSWLPSWVLELVSVFFALVIALALLRFVLGS